MALALNNLKRVWYAIKQRNQTKPNQTKPNWFVYRATQPTEVYPSLAMFRDYVYAQLVLVRPLSNPFLYPLLLITWTPIAQSICWQEIRVRTTCQYRYILLHNTLNNLRWLIGHKNNQTKPNQTKPNQTKQLVSYIPQLFSSPARSIHLSIFSFLFIGGVLVV